MTTPHKCPVCEGTRVVVDHACITCDGTGVVWEAEDSITSIPQAGYTSLPVGYTSPDTNATYTGPGPTGGPYYATSLSKPATTTSSAPGATS